MGRAVAISSLALVVCAFVALAQQPQPSASIEGFVVRADTGAPIAGAEVILTGGSPPDPAAAPAAPAGRGAGRGARPVRPTRTTGADGKFSFKNLTASAYGLSAGATGFVNQQYGQKVMYGTGRSIFLAAGQALKDAEIRLTPQAAISGKISDERGQPAIGAAVHLFRVEYAPLAKLVRPVGDAIVDDRGEFRIFGVIPGAYYLVAGTPAMRRGSGASDTARYTLVYYPNSPDIEQSMPVEVRSGETRVDMRVRRQLETYRVRGRIVDPGGPVLPAVSLGILSRWLSLTEETRGRVLDPATGAFEFENLMPGEYTVHAEAGTAAAQATVRVTDKDVHDLVLTLRTGVTASGRVSAEGRPLSTLGNLDSFRLSFTGAITGLNITLPTPVSTAPTADGRFEVSGVRDGEFRVQARIFSLDFYVKSVNYGGAEVLGKVHKFTASDVATFNVTIRPGTAQISGTVTDRQSQPVPGIQVFLISVDRDRPDLYRINYTDQNGRFLLTNIVPGDYKIFSWEAAATGQPFDPDFIKIYEPQVQVTHVTEASNQTVNVKMFPAP
jgi:hypothetical protein